MTYVGKILVIIIMVFSLFFLALSTVVFSTATNWKEETNKQKDQVRKLQEQVNTAKSEAEARGKELATTVQQHKAAIAALESEKQNLEAQSKQRQDEITDQRKSLETALQNTKVSVEDAEARRREADQLRETLAAVQQQSNDFKLRQTELNDQIRILQRELDVAKNNNQNLRERVTTLSSVIRQAGLNPNVERLKGLDNPPDVEGQVTKVDARNQRVEISIGSDDGLVEGHTLYLYRSRGPDAGYIGKIQLDLVDPDNAVGHVVGGQTHQGKKIREGDSVATQIKSRG